MHIMSNVCTVALIAAVLLAVCGPAAAVGAFPLQTLEGETQLVDNFGERKATVFVFLSARCPETERLIGTIEAVHELYRHKEILVVGIVPNSVESGEEIRVYCQRKGVRFPVYRDPQGEAAALLGATVTPEAVMVDDSGEVIYRGAIVSGGETPLADAMQAVHEGEKVPVAEMQATGTPISGPGPPREVEDPYGFIHFQSELVFEVAPGAVSHHCSTLTEAANGDVLCLWYGGSYESANDQALFLSRRKAGERTWSAPEPMLRDSLRPPGNALIFTDGIGRIWIIWGRMDASRPLRRGGGWDECTLLYRISEDHGRTWSQDKEMPELDRALPRNVPITMDNGELLLPLTGHEGERSGGLFLITADNGASWTTSELIPTGSQPTVVQRSDGSLLTFLRSRPRILRSISTDHGRTWSGAEPTDLACPGAGIAMTRLENGHILLVHNDSATSRTPLSVRRSVDDGETWEDALALETNPGEYSYPCVIQTSDGMIHISYTFRRTSIKHIEMNETWLTLMDRPN